MSFQQRRGVKLTMLDSNGRMKGVMQRSVAYAICPYVNMPDQEPPETPCAPVIA